MNVAKELRQLLVELAHLDSDFPAGADLYRDLNISSSVELHLWVQLEQSFGVAIPHQQFARATTLEALVALVTEHLIPSANDLPRFGTYLGPTQSSACVVH
jgi:acyl carrier protein